MAISKDRLGGDDAGLGGSHWQSSGGWSVVIGGSVREAFTPFQIWPKADLRSMSVFKRLVGVNAKIRIKLRSGLAKISPMKFPSLLLLLPKTLQVTRQLR